MLIENFDFANIKASLRSAWKHHQKYDEDYKVSDEMFSNINQICDALIEQFQYERNQSRNLPEVMTVEELAEMIKGDAKEVISKKNVAAKIKLLKFQNKKKELAKFR